MSETAPYRHAAIAPATGRAWAWPLRWSDGAFFAAVALVCGLCVFIGVAAPLGSFAHDNLFFLGNADRVLHGQVPHRDFSSAWGPIMCVIDAAGLALAGMKPAGLGYASALFGAIVSVWTFLLIRPRWSPMWACVLGIHAILLITAPFALGFHPLDFSYAMEYNRFGFALFGVVVVGGSVGALPPSQGARRTTTCNVSVGVAVGLLAFLKISYALVAMGFVAGCLIIASTAIIAGTAPPSRLQLRRHLGRTLLGLGLGFALVAVPVLCYLRFDLADMLADLAMAADARRMSLQPFGLLNATTLVQSAPLLLLAGFVVTSHDGADRATRLRGAAFLLLTVVAGYLLLISNQQSNTFPLNGYATVVAAAAFAPRGTGRSAAWSRLKLVVPVILCLLPLGLENAESLGGAAIERHWPTRPRVTSLASARGADLQFGPLVGPFESATDGEEYVAALNDGMALLRRHASGGEGVLVFDMFNPFNYLLDLPAPRGGFAASAYNYIFSDRVHPTADRLFGNAPLVLVRKYLPPAPGRDAEGNDVAAMLRIYGPALRARFAVVEETEHWVLWRRR